MSDLGLAGSVENDAVSSFEACDLADFLSGCGIDNFDLGAMSDVQNMHGGVSEQIVPATFAANLPMVNNGVCTVSGKRVSGKERRGGEAWQGRGRNQGGRKALGERIRSGRARRR